MKNTLQLVFVAEFLAILIAVGIGVYSALTAVLAFDYTATTFSFLGLATPVFWLALMLQVLVVQIYEKDGPADLPDREPELGRPGQRDPLRPRPRPSSGAAGHRADGRQHRAVLALHARLDARGDQLRLRAHRARQGPRRAQVTMKHAFRNALIPLVTLVALNFGALLGGAVVTETVFSLDGMGLYFINALHRQRPVSGHGVADGHGRR